MIGDSYWPCAAVAIVLILAAVALRITGPGETCERPDGTTSTVTTRTSAVGGVGVEGARRGSSGGAVSDER